MRYIALLRGVNVGGKNKVSMADLKATLEQDGFENVKTYINSGNVLFDNSSKDANGIAERCEALIEKAFGFPVACVVLSSVQYRRIVDNAPAWWGHSDDKNLRSDALFVLRHGTARAVIDAVGPVNEEYEHVGSAANVVFWTVDMRRYGKARLPKIIGSDEYKTVSMRSSTTTRKLYALLED